VKMVQAKVVVGPDRKISVQLPEDVTEGEYTVTVVLWPTRAACDRPAILYAAKTGSSS
jgi:hypothetical protein